MSAHIHRWNCRQLGEARGHLQEVARFLQRYGGHNEVDPWHWDEVEAPLVALQRPARMHIGSVEAVLARRADCYDSQVQGTTNIDARVSNLEEQLSRADSTMTSQRGSLQRGQKLEAVIEAKVQDMDRAGPIFHTQLSPRRDAGDLAAVQGHVPWPPSKWRSHEAPTGEVPGPQVCIVSGSEFLRLIWRLSELWAIMARCQRTSSMRSTHRQHRPQDTGGCPRRSHITCLHSLNDNLSLCQTTVSSLSLFSLCRCPLLYHKIHRLMAPHTPATYPTRGPHIVPSARLAQERL